MPQRWLFREVAARIVWHDSTRTIVASCEWQSVFAFGFRPAWLPLFLRPVGTMRIFYKLNAKLVPANQLEIRKECRARPIPISVISCTLAEIRSNFGVFEKRVELMASNDSAGASYPKARGTCIPSGHRLRRGEVVANLKSMTGRVGRGFGFPRSFLSPQPQDVCSPCIAPLQPSHSHSVASSTPCPEAHRRKILEFQGGFPQYHTCPPPRSAYSSGNDSRDPRSRGQRPSGVGV